MMTVTAVVFAFSAFVWALTGTSGAPKWLGWFFTAISLLSALSVWCFDRGEKNQYKVHYLTPELGKYTVIDMLNMRGIRWPAFGGPGWCVVENPHLPVNAYHRYRCSNAGARRGSWRLYCLVDPDGTEQLMLCDRNGRCIPVGSVEEALRIMEASMDFVHAALIEIARDVDETLKKTKRTAGTPVLESLRTRVHARAESVGAI
jgi:hypothetical protein